MNTGKVLEEVCITSNSSFCLHVRQNGYKCWEVWITHADHPNRELLLACDGNKQIALKRAREELERIIRLTHLINLPE